MNLLLRHPKLDVLYNPLLDDSELACKSSKEGCLYNPLLDDYTSSRIGCFVLYNPLLDDYVCVKLYLKGDVLNVKGSYCIKLRSLHSTTIQFL